MHGKCASCTYVGKRLRRRTCLRHYCINHTRPSCVLRLMYVGHLLWSFTSSRSPEIWEKLVNQRATSLCYGLTAIYSLLVLTGFNKRVINSQLPRRPRCTSETITNQNISGHCIRRGFCLRTFQPESYCVLFSLLSHKFIIEISSTLSVL